MMTALIPSFPGLFTNRLFLNWIKIVHPLLATERFNPDPNDLDVIGVLDTFPGYQVVRLCGLGRGKLLLLPITPTSLFLLEIHMNED